MTNNTLTNTYNLRHFIKQVKATMSTNTIQYYETSPTMDIVPPTSTENTTTTTTTTQTMAVVDNGYDEDVMSAVTTDARDISHAFCTPLRDIQYYARRRMVGQYTLTQPWVVYKAVVLKASPICVAYLKLLVPVNTHVIIGRDDMRLFGISYWIRVSRAKIVDITRIQPNSDALLTEDHIANIELKRIDVCETKSETYKVGDTFQWPNKHKRFSYSTKRMLTDGTSADGLLIQPTFSEAIKVGEAMSGINNACMAFPTYHEIMHPSNIYTLHRTTNSRHPAATYANVVYHGTFAHDQEQEQEHEDGQEEE